MKQTFFKVRNASFVLALSGLMTTFSLPSLANSKRTAAISSVAIQPSVTYIGSDENAASFLVKTVAAVPVKFEVSLTDDAGLVFYSQVFEAATFSKTFKVLNTNGSHLNMAFNIKVLPDGKATTFMVSSEEKTITEIAVNRTK